MYIGKTYCIVVILLLQNTCRLFSQDTLSFTVVDKTTYQLYETRQWEALRAMSAVAFKGGYDYYYLRVRAGIAAFETKRYKEAIGHFRKALVFNDGDNLSYEYLYFSYLYSNREETARKLSKSFGKDFDAYMRTNTLRPVTLIQADGGFKLSDSLHRFEPAVFGQLAASHFVGRSMSLFHAVSYYSQAESRFSVRQFQYYVRTVIPLKSELTLTGGVHLLYANNLFQERTITQHTVQDPPPAAGAKPPPVRTFTKLEVQNVDQQALAGLGAVTLTKHLTVADVSAGVTAMFQDTAKQYQLSAGLMVYPFKNNELALGANGYLHTVDLFGTLSMALAPSVTSKVFKGFYINLTYFNNNGLNTSEQTGYIVNNSYDYTLRRWTFSPYYVISPRCTIYTTFGLEEKKEISHAFKYHYAIFLAGIRFNTYK